jgi:hypothetical protein
MEEKNKGGLICFALKKSTGAGGLIVLYIKMKVWIGEKRREATQIYGNQIENGRDLKERSGIITKLGIGEKGNFTEGMENGSQSGNARFLLA